MIGLKSRDITAPYGAAEAYLYDRWIAPAVEALVEEQIEAYLDEVAQGGSILDVGCGGGQNLLLLLARRGDLRATGLDLSPKQVARARRRAAACSVPAARPWCYAAAAPEPPAAARSRSHSSCM